MWRYCGCGSTTTYCDKQAVILIINFTKPSYWCQINKHYNLRSKVNYYQHSNYLNRLNHNTHIHYHSPSHVLCFILSKINVRYFSKYETIWKKEQLGLQSPTQWKSYVYLIDNIKCFVLQISAKRWYIVHGMLQVCKGGILLSY